VGSRILLQRSDGKSAEGYLAKSGGANAPGMVVIQEWWGLQDQIKGICDRFAMAGYDALAPDLYGGRVVPYHGAEAVDREMNSLNFLEATDQLIRGAVQFLKKSSGSIGLTGFCLGGAVTIIGACRFPEIDAAICFYGLPADAVAKPADMSCPCRAISRCGTIGARLTL
jgi:carboxymethylenebutenolidase